MIVTEPVETFLQRRLREKAEREAAERAQSFPEPPTLRHAATEITTRGRAWVATKLAQQCADVAAAPEGTRNHTLNAAAYSLGRFIPKWLDHDEVGRALYDAARTSGLEHAEAVATIGSGLASGTQEPRDPPTGPDDTSGGLAGLVAGPVATRAAPEPRVHTTTGEVIEEPAAAEQEAPPSSWARVDLTAYVDGTHVPEKPAMLLRSDTAATIYPGRVHWLAGEPEALKSWLALLAVAQVLHRGGRSVYIDLEDGPSGVTGRLLAMGVPPHVLLERFDYRSPHEPLRYTTREQMTPDIAGTDLLVIDACTESLALQQLSPKDDVDVASWLALLPRWATRLGPAVLVLDHVIKDPETRGRWATGSQHKLAGLDGVAFTLEAVTPGGVGMRGRSRLYVSKDRHGQVRPATVPTSGNKQWLGDLVVDSTGAFVDVVLHPPVEHSDEFRPTVLMERIAQVLERTGPLSKTQLVERVKGRNVEIKRALAHLVDDGFVTVERAERGAELHALSKPYPPVEES